MTDFYDIGIAGGGASGSIAAISAKLEGAGSIALLEKNKAIMKKVIASGNGRCNISNDHCASSSEVLSFFENMGIYTICEEEGRRYPRTRYSRTVSDRFEEELARKKIDVFTEFNIEEIQIMKHPAGYRFKVSSGKKEIMFRKLLLCCGGKAGPQFGTVGDSFRFLKKLGHSVTALRPSLTAIECRENMEALKGIRAAGIARLLKQGEKAAPDETGEIQFTKDGLSGICVMNLSRNIVLDRGIPFKDAYERYEIELDLAADLSEAAVKNALLGMLSKGMRPLDAASAFVRRELAEYILEKGSLDAGAIAGRIKHLRFTVSGCKGWKDAQVTGGGVPLEEVNQETMESKILPGLYIAGECLDYDGPCGGYNLNHAWHTGILAGKAMAACIESVR